MKVANQTVVSIHYTLKNSDGQVLDSSEGQPALDYIHGAGNIIPGLENALTDREVGDKFNVAIPPEEAYGLPNEKLLHKTSLDKFQDKDEVKEGAQFQISSPQGAQIATVIKVENDEVTLDFNHPLAGQTLHFDVEITAVREATEEELSHGHAHGDGGCGCDH